MHVISNDNPVEIILTLKDQALMKNTFIATKGSVSSGKLTY